MRVAEANRHTGSFSQLRVFAHLPPLIAGEGFAQLGGNRTERLAEPVQGRLRCAIGHLGQHHHQRGAFNQRAHRGTVHRAFDQVGFPVSGYQAIRHFGRAQVDALHCRDVPTPIRDASLGATFIAAQTAGRQSVHGAAHPVAWRTACGKSFRDSLVVRVGLGTCS